MAKSRGVWGIDIGQSALKALRCHIDDDNKVVADTYDFIEYPKALSLPDADEEVLVSDAMDTFLSRNDLRGDFVSMCVSGQAGLSRFFKPPPVDAKTLPDIVKYEVKQQIPFPIDDVIWDWQSLGGTEMDNVIVDTEVGLFAIKRDTVFAALQPFLRADMEVDLVQLSPLATHNVICKEVIENIPSIDEIDMDNLPDSVVVLSMGTDATDLIVTNGIKLWLRNIPIGGNHFTKQLSRELKLTHAKAEHLKRNARQAEDPKTVFQAMRPVFNDLVTEIQRSLSFYAGMEKNTNIEQIVLLGNAARLPGLRQYLTKQLELNIAKVGEYKYLTGPVVDERTFKENLLSFAPCYGLCLQGLDQSQIKTNLLPREFVFERVIRAKKPWALASVGLLMLGMLFSYFFVNQGWWKVNPEYVQGGNSWKKAMDEVTVRSNLSARLKREDDDQKDKLDRINLISGELSEASETQAVWPELISAFAQILPRDDRLEGKLVANPDEFPFEDRREIYIDHVESEFQDDLIKWQGSVVGLFRDQRDITVSGPKKMLVYKDKDGNVVKRINAADEATEAPDDPDKLLIKNEEIVKPAAEYDVSGPGWVLEIQAHHFYNSREKRDMSVHGRDFVKKYLVDRILDDEFVLPGKDGNPEKFKFEDIGIYYPTITSEKPLYTDNIPNPNYGEKGRERDVNQPADDSDQGNSGDEAVAEESDVPEFFTVTRYDFTMQMAFIPSSVNERVAAREARLKEDAKQEAQTPAAQTPTAPTGPANNTQQTTPPAQDASQQPPADVGDPNKKDQKKSDPDKPDKSDSKKTDPADADPKTDDGAGDDSKSQPPGKSGGKSGDGKGQ